MAVMRIMRRRGGYTKSAFVANLGFDNALIGEGRLVADTGDRFFPAKHKCNLRVCVRGKYHREVSVYLLATVCRLLLETSRLRCFDK